MDEDKIPRPDELIAFFAWSGKYSNDMILSLIESQNDNIITDAWRILRRHIKGDHVELVLTVDDASLRKLRERQFVLNYRYGQILIKKKRSGQLNTAEQTPSNALEDVAMDSIRDQQDLAMPGTSGVGRGPCMLSKTELPARKASPEISVHQAGGGSRYVGSNVQGQSSAYGYGKPPRNMQNTNAGKSSVQCRLQQRE